MAKTSDKQDDETNGEDNQGKRKRAKAKKEAAVADEDDLTEQPEPVAKAKAKSKPSTKSQAAGQSKKNTEDEKPKKKQKTQEDQEDPGKTEKAKKQKTEQKTAEKTKKPRASSARRQEVDVNAYPELQTELATWVKDFIDYSDLDMLKLTVKEARGKFEYFRLNIYWTSFKCGLTMKKVGEKATDVACFTFDEKTLRACAVAIGCAEHLTI